MMHICTLTFSHSKILYFSRRYIFSSCSYYIACYLLDSCLFLILRDICVQYKPKYLCLAIDTHISFSI